VCVREREITCRNKQTKKTKHPKRVEKGGKEVGQEHKNQH